MHSLIAADSRTEVFPILASQAPAKLRQSRRPELQQTATEQSDKRSEIIQHMIWENKGRNKLIADLTARIFNELEEEMLYYRLHRVVPTRAVTAS